MRLKQLKLAGFKSFAEATTLKFPNPLTAIVGPNGCGKSNIIDAIRWVLGESSAKQLRGGAMTDVIFAGSASKNAMSYASVELVFENAGNSLSAQLKNEYNLYHELSVRRQVSMEGRSDYFLNGTRCRKRDIVNLFLGTGLGARSYAVIEQGMISRLVDAKPEGMRTYVEEAAGVSKYQAKRAETARHLAHAQDNLNRLEDIREELDKQIRSLKRQANVAERYKALLNEKSALEKTVLLARLANAYLHSLELRAELDGIDTVFSQKRKARLVAETESLLKKKVVESSAEQLQTQQDIWQKAHNAALEAAHKHVSSIQKLDGLHQEEDSLREQIQALKATQQNDSELLASTAKKIEQMLPELETVQQKLDTKKAELNHIEVAKLEVKLSELTKQNQHYESLQHVSSRQADAIEKQRERLLGRKIELDNLQSAIVAHSYAQQITVLEAQIADSTTKLTDATAQKTTLTQSVEAASARVQQKQNEQNELTQKLTSLNTELNTLKRLHAKQASAITQAQVGKSLLTALSLTDAGKAHAELIELYLADWLSAAVHDATPAQTQVAARSIWQGTCCAPSASELKKLSCTLTPLRSWVDLPNSALIDNTLVIDTVDFDILSALPDGVVLLSKDGRCYGNGWLIDLNQAKPSFSPISQQVRIDELTAEKLLLDKQLELAQQALDTTQNEQRTLQSALNAQDKTLLELQKRQQSASLSLAKIQAEASSSAQEKQRIQTQLAGLERELLELDDDQATLLEEKGEALAACERLKPELDKLTDMLAQAKRTQDVQRQSIHEITSALHRLQLDKQHLDSQSASLTQALERSRAQQASLTPRFERIKSQKHQLQAGLEALEERKKHYQSEATAQKLVLDDAQKALQAVQNEQRALEDERDAVFKEEEELREQLIKLELAFELAEQKQEQFYEQLAQQDKLTDKAAAKAKLELSKNSALDFAMSEEYLAAHATQLEEINTALVKIGGVNLAAAEDLVQLSARFKKLMEQIADVEQSVAKLGSAMQQIDMETRGLFLATLKTVNDNLNELFPKVFGGGQAQLTLEEAGNWQSGVVLMAQPPGKKNTRLALLSGGEKALTAMALVFSIFKLNPAPFCVLDEVDAPLDDANIARFCNLVKELATSVQFIYISHNKLAMHMANDLLGVTMPRAGVSALVSVSLDEASQFHVA